MTRIKVTTENIEEVREMVLASDMAEGIAVGQEIETWAITYENGQRTLIDFKDGAFFA